MRSFARKPGFVGRLAAGLLAVLLLSARPVGAQFLVNSTGDEADASPLDFICLTAGGTCTLRAAIQQANTVPGPPGGAAACSWRRAYRHDTVHDACTRV